MFSGQSEFHCLHHSLFSFTPSVPPTSTADALSPGDCVAGGTLSVQAVREEMDQHRRGTHPTGPLCCHGSHLAAAGSICSMVAHWSGGGTALCVWCRCGNLFGGAVLMVRWAAQKVYTHGVHTPTH